MEPAAAQNALAAKIVKEVLIIIAVL